MIYNYYQSLTSYVGDNWFVYVFVGYILFGIVITTIYVVLEHIFPERDFGCLVEFYVAPIAIITLLIAAPAFLVALLILKIIKRVFRAKESRKGS